MRRFDMVHDTLEQLIELQALDTGIKEANAKLALIPELLKSVKSEYDRADKERAKIDTEFNELKSKRLTTERELEERVHLLSNANRKLSNVQNSRDYEAALNEIDHLKSEVARLEGSCIEIKEDIRKIEAKVAEAKQKSEEKQKNYLETKTEKENENENIYIQAEELKQKREKFVINIPRSLISMYERVRKARGNIAVAPLNNDVCTGCYIAVPPQLAVEVKKEEELKQCPNCQRFLYSPREKKEE
jgi:predicted  nucleic acid-binding Zn-ribbon protein